MQWHMLPRCHHTTASMDTHNYMLTSSTSATCHIINTTSSTKWFLLTPPSVKNLHLAQFWYTLNNTYSKHNGTNFYRDSTRRITQCPNILEYNNAVFSVFYYILPSHSRLSEHVRLLALSRMASAAVLAPWPAEKTRKRHLFHSCL